jgi:hypothetical protein
MRQELLDWKSSWQLEFMPAIAEEGHAWVRAADYLEAWGILQYNATLLMLSEHSPEIAATYEAAKQVVRCCSQMARQHQHSLGGIPSDTRGMRCGLPIFPIDWTIAHLLFSSATHLLSPAMRNAVENKDWERTFRSCLVTMTLIGADPSNLSMGFSEILENQYEKDIN